jgi:hypothetical protein
MELYLPCPDHTTVSRRNRTVNVCRSTGSLPNGPVHFIVDSTGLKICGQGEWHSKKLHIGMDEKGWILASKVTDGHKHDSSQVPNLLAQVDRKIDRFVGDRVYDQEAVYEAVDHHSPGAEVVVPPVFPVIETVILRISRVKAGPSGNASLDTIYRVTRKMHSIDTRKSLVDG